MDLKIVRALVDLVSRSRGRRVTIKAKSLLKLAGVDSKHSNILKAAKVLGKLAKWGYVKIEGGKEGASKSRVLRYVVTENMEVWKLAKENPENAVRELMKVLLIEEIQHVGRFGKQGWE